MENWYFVLEMIGTAAFAVSGAMRGIEKKMDLFGVMILGMTTAVGGGIIRDMILGMTPPAAFRDPVYACTALLISFLVFIPSVRKIYSRRDFFYEKLLAMMDTIGLAVFTVVGIETAMSYTAKPNLFLAVFVGVLTGTGGGVLRDLFANMRPRIFIEDFYASASLSGALVCVLMWSEFGQLVSAGTGAAVIIILRLFAVRYHWHLPHADASEIQ